VIVALAVKDVVRVAVNEAYGTAALADTPVSGSARPLTGVYVTVPVIGEIPFRNSTAPVGAKPMLEVLTVAVRVTDWPDVTVVAGLAVTPMEVAA